MKSITSLFKPAIIRHDLKQHGWIGVLYTVAFFITGPLVIFLLSKRNESITLELFEMIARIEFSAYTLMFAGFSIFTGVFLFRYIHSEKSAGFIHSLPITRKEWINSHFISGLLIVNIPFLINGLAIWGMSYMLISSPGFNNTVLLKWFFYILLFQTSLFTFSMASAMITGTSVSQFVLGCIVLVLPVGLTYLVTNFLGNLLYGYANLVDTGTTVAFMLTPIAHVFSRTGRWAFYTEDHSTGIILLIQTIVYYGIAYMLYSLRNLENNGEIVTFKSVKELFKYGVTVCSALWFGNMTVEFMSSEEYSVLFYSGYFLGGLLGYVIAEAVLQKAMPSLKDYKGFAVTVICGVFIFAFAGTDVMGFERYVPNAKEVASVSIDGIAMNQPEDIEKVVALNQSLINFKDEVVPWDLARSVMIMYKLKDHSNVKRQYCFLERNVLAQWKKVVDTEAYRLGDHKIFQDSAKEIELISFRLGYSEQDKLKIDDPKEIKSLIEAFRKDALNETYEERYERNLDYGYVNFMKAREDDYETIDWMDFRKSNTYVQQWLADHYQISDCALDVYDIDRIEVIKDMNWDGDYGTSDEDEVVVFEVVEKPVMKTILEKASDHHYMRVLYYEGEAVYRLDIDNQNDWIFINAGELERIMKDYEVESLEEQNNA